MECTSFLFSVVGVRLHFGSLKRGAAILEFGEGAISLMRLIDMILGGAETALASWEQAADQIPAYQE